MNMCAEDLFILNYFSTIFTIWFYSWMNVYVYVCVTYECVLMIILFWNALPQGLNTVHHLVILGYMDTWSFLLIILFVTFEASTSQLHHIWCMKMCPDDLFILNYFSTSFTMWLHSWMNVSLYVCVAYEYVFWWSLILKCFTTSSQYGSSIAYEVWTCVLIHMRSYACFITKYHSTTI